MRHVSRTPWCSGTLCRTRELCRHSGEHKLLSDRSCIVTAEPERTSFSRIPPWQARPRPTLGCASWVTPVGLRRSGGYASWVAPVGLRQLGCASWVAPDGSRRLCHASEMPWFGLSLVLFGMMLAMACSDSGDSIRKHAVSFATTLCRTRLWNVGEAHARHA